MIAIITNLGMVWYGAGGFLLLRLCCHGRGLGCCLEIILLIFTFLSPPPLITHHTLAGAALESARLEISSCQTLLNSTLALTQQKRKPGRMREKKAFDGGRAKSLG